MRSETHRTLEAKKEHRKQLANASVAIKLAKLDALRDRMHAIRSDKRSRASKSAAKDKGKPARR
ncbi:MAG: hypothetical protein WD825_05700 [Gemmatimonadaceae bacterium]